MKYLFLFLALSACAPEYNTTHDEPVAGRVASITQDLSCGTPGGVCNGLRGAIETRTNTHWTYSSACSAEDWYATAPGGRTLTARRWLSAQLEQRFVVPSQSGKFSVSCSCQNANNALRCHVD